jgi:hypothetical protein
VTDVLSAAQGDGRLATSRPRRGCSRKSVQVQGLKSAEQRVQRPCQAKVAAQNGQQMPTGLASAPVRAAFLLLLTSASWVSSLCACMVTRGRVHRPSCLAPCATTGRIVSVLSYRVPKHTHRSIAPRLDGTINRRVCGHITPSSAPVGQRFAGVHAAVFSRARRTGATQTSHSRPMTHDPKPRTPNFEPTGATTHRMCSGEEAALGAADPDTLSADRESRSAKHESVQEDETTSSEMIVSFNGVTPEQLLAMQARARCRVQGARFRVQCFGPLSRTGKPPAGDSAFNVLVCTGLDGFCF